MIMAWAEMATGKSGLLGGIFFLKNLDGNIHVDIGSFIKKKINIELEKSRSPHCTI